MLIIFLPLSQLHLFQGRFIEGSKEFYLLLIVWSIFTVQKIFISKRYDKNFFKLKKNDKKKLSSLMNFDFSTDNIMIKKEFYNSLTLIIIYDAY